MTGIAWRFGRLQSELALLHGVNRSKDTAFQARLKNFHRLGFPEDLRLEKGRAALYQPGHIAMMALAVELTQLGLTPERVVVVLTLNRFPTAMAIGMAARALIERPDGFDPDEEKASDPLSMFLFFDPSALAPLTRDDEDVGPDEDHAAETFFYGGEGVVREALVRWTSGRTPRLALLNVTAMVDRLARFAMLGNDAFERSGRVEFEEQRRATFLGELSQWADNYERQYETESEVNDVADQIADIQASASAITFAELARKISTASGRPLAQVRREMRRLEQKGPKRVD